MVYQIIRTKWSIFLEAFVMTMIIFTAGLLVGYLVESSRNSSIEDSFKQYEVESIDLWLQNYYYQTLDKASCNIALEENLKFADDIYLTGLEIEKFEQNNQMTDELKLEKERYVLLKTQLWLNSVTLKEKCGASFDTVVYFYSSDSSSPILVAQQNLISNILKGIKSDYGNNIILLPIAADLDLTIVNMQLKTYNITSAPAILVNEKTVLYGFNDASEVEKYLTKKKIISLQ